MFLPGESHGQSSRVGYSSWGRKASDAPEVADHRLQFRPLFISVQLPSGPSLTRFRYFIFSSIICLIC